MWWLSIWHPPALYDAFGRTSGQGNNESKQKSDEIHATFADLGATLIGATVIAFNIAPTDEISMLGAAVSPPWLLAIIATSVVISYGIVFEAGFSAQQKRRQQQGIFQTPLSETIMTYLVSLVTAAFMLSNNYELRIPNWSVRAASRREAT